MLIIKNCMIKLLVSTFMIVFIFSNNVFAALNNSSETSIISFKTIYSVSFAGAVMNDGSLWTWGQDVISPVKIIDNVAAVSGTNMVLKNDGSVWDWSAAGIPEKRLDGATSICNGGSVKYAVKNDGSLWIWGEYEALASRMQDREWIDGGGFYWQTYQPEMTNINIPQKLMDDVKSVVALGDLETLVVKTDGSLWGWGNRINGSNNEHVPKKLTDDVMSAQFADHDLYVLRPDKTLWKRYLYDENNGWERCMDNVKSFCCSNSGWYVIKDDDTLWSCGLDNRCGELGIPISDNDRYTIEVNENNASINSPYLDEIYGGEQRNHPIKIMDNVHSISCFCESTPYGISDGISCLAVKNDGTIWSWGSNKEGQLGYEGGDWYKQSGYYCQTVPKKIEGFTVKGF